MAAKTYEEGIHHLLDRNNHGFFIQSSPPESWFQLIQQSLRFDVRKGQQTASSILAFYLENEIDNDSTNELRMEYVRCLIYSGRYPDALRTCEHIRNSSLFQSQQATDAIALIHEILHKTNELRDSSQVIKMYRPMDDFGEFIKSINRDVLRPVFNDGFWRICKEDTIDRIIRIRYQNGNEQIDPSAPPPLDIADDLIDFVCKCLDIDSANGSLKDIKVLDVVTEVNRWNDGDTTTIGEGTTDSKQSDDGDASDSERLDVAVRCLDLDVAAALIDFLYFGVLSLLNQQRPRFDHANRVIQQLVQLAKIKKLREREAMLLLESARCFFRKRRYQQAIASSEEARKAAGKMRPKQIDLYRAALLMQIEIFESMKKTASKEALIDIHLEKDFNLQRAMEYRREHRRFSLIRCKYDDFELPKVDIVQLTDHGPTQEFDGDSDDDLIVMSSQPLRPSKKVPRSRFEESSDEEEDNLAVRQLGATRTAPRNPRKRLRSDATPSVKLLAVGSKRRKLIAEGSVCSSTFSDIETTTSAVADHRILDLASDSEEDDAKYETILESQNSIDDDDDVHEAVINYRSGGFQKEIERLERELRMAVSEQMNNTFTSSIGTTINIIELKVLLSDHWLQKAAFIRNNEPNGLERFKLVRCCLTFSQESSREVPEDCRSIIRKTLRPTNDISPMSSGDDIKKWFQSKNIKKSHSLLMLHYFARCIMFISSILWSSPSLNVVLCLFSLECFAKCLVHKNKEAVSKYTECIDKEVRFFESVHPAVTLHWFYYCCSNLAYSYRQRAALSADPNKTYDDRQCAKKWYQTAQQTLHKLSKIDIVDFPEVKERIMDSSERRRQSAYNMIETGHCCDELNLHQECENCYQKAAQLAEGENIDQEQESYYSLSLVLHHRNQYVRALHILQIECRRCIEECCVHFDDVRFRIRQFEIERLITDIFLSQNQMQSASKSVSRMMDIAQIHLSRQTQYLEEARSMQKRYKTNARYLSEIRSSKTRDVLPLLKRLYSIKSWGRILEERRHFLHGLRAMPSRQALSVMRMVGTAMKEKREWTDAQSLLMGAFENSKWQREVKGTEMARIALLLFEVMEFTTGDTRKRMEILMRGYMTLDANNRADLNFNIEYIQSCCLYHEHYFVANGNQPKRQIAELQQRLASLQRLHPDSNRVRRATTRARDRLFQRNQHRYRSHRRHYRSMASNRHIYGPSKAKSKGGVFSIASTRQQQRRNEAMTRQRHRHSANAQTHYNCQMARNFAGLSEQSNPDALKAAVNDIDRILNDNPSLTVVTELNNIKRSYQRHLQIATKKWNEKEQRQRNQEVNPFKIVPTATTLNIKNNPIGIRSEDKEWLFSESTSRNTARWQRFSASDAQEMERAFQNEEKSVFVANGKVQFNVRGEFKTMERFDRRNKAFFVQRRVMVGPVNDKKIKNWAIRWMKDQRISNQKRYKLNQHAAATKTEYNAVCQLVKDRGLSAGVEIHRIERIQNMLTQCRYNDCRVDEQLLLFHGTGPSSVTPIIEEGTDFRLSGANGTRYGHGSYFAVYSSYAAQFCSPPKLDEQIGKFCRYMFLCAVRAGRYCEGSAGLRRPPKAANGHSYDSVTDSMDHPSIFVTFDNSQCQPLYLISFSVERS